MSGADILGYIILFTIIGLCIYIYVDNYGEFQLTCIVSNEDGNKYCVREKAKYKKPPTF